MASVTHASHLSGHRRSVISQHRRVSGIQHWSSAGTVANADTHLYLRALYFSERDGEVAGAIIIARQLNVSVAKAAQELRRLIQLSLALEAPSRAVTLTALGRIQAETVVRRHALAERLLTDLLGVPWHEAHEEADQLHHWFTPRVEAAVLKVLGRPRTCPHGSPIPGLGQLWPNELSLEQAVPGAELELVRLTASAERNPELLHYLYNNGVVPGSRIRVREAALCRSVMAIDSGDGSVLLGYPIAAQLRVIYPDNVAATGAYP